MKKNANDLKYGDVVRLGDNLYMMTIRTDKAQFACKLGEDHANTFEEPFRNIIENDDQEFEIVPPEEVPHDGYNYIVLRETLKGSLTVESMNGVPIPIYTQNGVLKVLREVHEDGSYGKMMLNVNLCGIQSDVKSVIHGPAAKVYVRNLDGTLHEYTDIEKVDK